MTRILLTAVIGCGLTGVIGYLLLPVLRALKVGQSIREVGPTWHRRRLILWVQFVLTRMLSSMQRLIM